MGLSFRGGSDNQKFKGDFSKRPYTLPSKAIPFIHSRPKVKACRRHAGSSTIKKGQILKCYIVQEEVLLRVNEQRNILQEIRNRKANWIRHILSRNCLLKQVIEGKIKGEMEVARRRARRRKKLLDDLKDRRGYSHLKEEALDRTVWRNRFGGSFGPVVRQNTEWMSA